MKDKMLPLRSIWRLVSCLAALLLLTPGVSFAAPVRHTFESAPDGAAIANTIPGLRFSVSGGGNWFYGDVRSGKYDAPYPQKAFAVDGNGFAWTGEQVGEGRIDVTTGTATFFAAAFSTKESLSIAAYNRKDQQLAAHLLRANANTGRLDMVRLEAPAGQGIAYVLISGTQNRWIMDNLEIDVSLAAPKEDGQPAQVTVVQQPTPSLGAPPDSTISYSIVATNRGKGAAKNIVTTVSFDPTEVRVVDVRFSREGAWVSKLLADTLEIQTGPLGGGDTVTGTLRLAVQPSVAPGTLLGERLSFRWSDSSGGGEGRSNLPILVVAALPSSPPTYALAVVPERGVIGIAHTFTSPIFAPGEPVALWYTTPDGKSITVDTVNVNGEGQLITTFTTDSLPAGRYTMVAHGLWTRFTATAVFSIEPPR